MVLVSCFCASAALSAMITSLKPYEVNFWFVERLKSLSFLGMPCLPSTTLEETPYSTEYSWNHFLKSICCKYGVLYFFNNKNSNINALTCISYHQE